MLYRKRSFYISVRRTDTGYATRLLITILTGGSLLLSGGCSNKAQTGSVVGSVIGAVVGARFGKGHGRLAASIAGSLAGSYIGGRIGRQMDREDYYRTQHALEHNRTGQMSYWRNDRTGYRYRYRPVRTYYRRGRPCREFHLRREYRGRVLTRSGIACRTADGKWLIVKG